MSTINDHGTFCTKTYMAPSKKPRGYWHGDNAADKVFWAWAPRSPCGMFWQTSKTRGGFATEAEAINDAMATLSNAAPQAGAEKLSEGTGTQRRDLESPCSPAAAAPNCA